MAMLASYEWMPFRRFGSLGLYLESGFSVSRGRGQLADGQKAEEAYSLYIVPMTAFLKYHLNMCADSGLFHTFWVVELIMVYLNRETMAPHPQLRGQWQQVAVAGFI